MQEAAPAIGLQIQVLNATTMARSMLPFATFANERPDALYFPHEEVATSMHRSSRRMDRSQRNGFLRLLGLFPGPAFRL